MKVNAADAKARMLEASRLVERVARTHPLVVELAATTSFAVRVDPILLRRLRIRLFPQSAASLEAGLWQSELVHVRSPDGITLPPWVAAALRERLWERFRERYEPAWEVTRDAHAHLPETLRVEEELNYLERLRTTGAKRRATAILQRAIATVIGSNDRWIAAWGAGAASRASAAKDLGVERRLLSVASTSRLGATTPMLERGDDWLSWAAGEGVERVPVRIRMGSDWIAFRAQAEADEAHPSETDDESADAAGGSMIALPRTSPMTVKLGEVRRGESMRWRTVELRADAPTLVHIASTDIVVRTLLGDEYAIRPRSGRERWTIPTPLPDQIGYERQLSEVVRRLLVAEGVPVVVEGPAGAGRRQFGLRVADAVKERFERGTFIRLREGAASERALLGAILRRLGAEHRGSVDALRASVTDLTLSQPTLIVIDSTAPTLPIERLRVGGHSALLLLHRWSEFPQDVLPQVVRIAGLERERAIQLFTRSFGQPDRSVPLDTVHEILEACDFLPVPIIEVAKLAATLRDDEVARLPAMIRGAVRLAAIPHPFDRDAARELLGENEPDENAYETRAS